MASSLRRTLAVVALPVLLVAATALGLLASGDGLDARVAVHFGLDGAADGFSSGRGLLLMTVGIQVAVGALLATIATAAGRQVAGDRMLAALPAGVVTFVGALTVLLVRAQQGIPAEQASIGGPHLLAALGAAAVASTVAARLAPPPAAVADAHGPPPPGAPRATVEGPVAWTGRTRDSRAVLVVAGVLALVGLGGLALAPPVLAASLLPLLLVAALVVAGTRFRVAVGPRRLVVRGVLGWPGVSIPMSTVTRADVEEVRPMAYGGWGWRVRLDRRTAVVTAAGPGLVVHRSDGAVLVVTIDEAEHVAGIVNGLLDRREATRAVDPG